MYEYNELLDLVLEATHASGLDSFSKDIQEVKKNFMDCRKNNDLPGMRAACGDFERLVSTLEAEIDELKSTMTSNTIPSILRNVAIAAAAITGILKMMSSRYENNKNEVMRQHIDAQNMYNHLSHPAVRDNPYINTGNSLDELRNEMDIARNLLVRLNNAKNKTDDRSTNTATTAVLAAGGGFAMSKRNEKLDMAKVGTTRSQLKKITKTLHKTLKEMKKMLVEAERRRNNQYGRV